MTPESIAEAFGRGLMQGMIGQQAAAAAPAPVVVPVDAVKSAVADYLRPFVEEEPPTGPQLDLFTHGIENEPSDPVAEMALRRLEEARARAAAQDADVPEPGTYHPDYPTGTPWVSPERNTA